MKTSKIRQKLTNILAHCKIHISYIIKTRVTQTPTPNYELLNLRDIFELFYRNSGAHQPTLLIGIMVCERKQN